MTDSSNNIEINQCSESNICEHLKKRIVEGGRGLYAINLINISDQKTEFLGVVYRETKKDKGLLINFCPWCGKTPGTFKNK